jgi:flagellar protein FlgJ
MNTSMNSPALGSIGSMTDYAASNYNDINALQSIKYDTSDQEGRIDAISKQFESMYVSMMLKGMRDANKAFSEGNPLNSSQGDFYQDMYDSQLAVSLSTSKGFGLADVIKQQLMQRYNLDGGSAADAQASSAEKFSMAGYARTMAPMQMSSAELVEAVQKVDSHIEAMSAETLKTETAIVQPDQLNDPQSFIEALYPMAKRVEAETGIDARLMLAQSALETGWGKKQIVQADGEPSFNLFGIKAHRDWGGEQTEIVTTEFRAGVALKERASFRVYDSFDASFRDYAQFLQGNTRYSEALAQKSDPVAFAHALQDSGYATDPQYGNKIERILDRYMSDLQPDAGARSNLNSVQQHAPNGER